MIVSIASTTRDAGSSAMSPDQTIDLLRVFRKEANNIMMDFIIGERTSCLAVCVFFLLCGVYKLEEFHEDIVSCRELDVTDFL